VVRIYDRPRGSTTRLSQEGREVESAWHPDGRSLAVSGGLPNAGIFLRQLDGTSRLIVPLPADATIFRHASWSPDGAQLAYTIQTGNRYDIWVLTMGDQLATAPFLETAADPAFSPDGRWLAYMSNESGRNEVYLQAYPEGEQLAISTDGGFAPVWSRDGREIFFAVPGEGGGSLMAVSVAAEGDTLALGRPEPLFDLRVSGPTGAVERYVIGSNAGPGYDVLPDGRFVMVRSAVTRQHEIVLVQNWFEELMARAPIP